MLSAHTAGTRTPYMDTAKTMIRVIQTSFEEFEKVRIPAKGITGTIIDIFVGNDSVTYYTVENEAWGDVDDPDAWNIGYAQFTCMADQLAHVAAPNQ